MPSSPNGGLLRTRGTRHSRTLLPLATVIAVAATPLLSAAPSAATASVTTDDAAWTTPAFVRTVGARGSAGLYAWGVAFNPATTHVLVGDYLNYQVREFTTEGTLLKSFYRSASERRGQPEGIAVDPRTGDIFVSDHARGSAGYVARFSVGGSFKQEYRLPGVRYNAWITVDHAGYLYVSDSHSWNNAADPPKIRKFDVSGSSAREVLSFGSYPNLGQITGVAVDPEDGKIYLADLKNKRVNVWNSNGTPHAIIGDGKFSGDMRGVAVNEGNRQLYVVDAGAGQVERFNLDTKAHLGTFGSLGSGPGQFGDGGRGITVDDHDDVWVADYGNTRVLKFSASGSFLAAYPNPPQKPPAGSLAQPRDVAIGAANAVWTVEQNNHRLQRFTPAGAPNGMWGKRGSTPPLGFNYPRGIAVQPGSGRIWVANTTEASVRVLTPTMKLAFEIKKPGYLTEVIDIEFGNGKAYIGDANGGRVIIVNPSNGAILGAISKRCAGVAVNPAGGDVYCSSWYDDRIYRYSKSGSLLDTFGTPGSGTGQLTNPWDIDIAGGTLWVTDADRAKVLAYSLGGTFLGEFGSAGDRPGQFNNPSGITHDGSGKLYVADAGNDRIQVFDPKASLPSDSSAPAVRITKPSGSTPLPVPTTLTGTVSDNTRVGTVELAIQNQTTNMWWDGRTSTWASTKAWTNAGVKGSGTTSGQWWFPLIGAQRGQGYRLEVRAFDARLNTSAIVVTTFRISG